MTATPSRITDERLRMLTVGHLSTVGEINAVATELLAARAVVEAVEKRHWSQGGCKCDLCAALCAYDDAATTNEKAGDVPQGATNAGGCVPESPAAPSPAQGGATAARLVVEPVKLAPRWDRYGVTPDLWPHGTIGSERIVGVSLLASMVEEAESHAAAREAAVRAECDATLRKSIAAWEETQRNAIAFHREQEARLSAQVRRLEAENAAIRTREIGPLIDQLKAANGRAIAAEARGGEAETTRDLDRDRLWCEALASTLGPREMLAVLRHFNAARAPSREEQKP